MPTTAEKPATSEIWQARIPYHLARELEADAAALGLEGRSEVVREALKMLHRRAAEQRMADGISEFYGGEEAPLPASLDY